MGLAHRWLQPAMQGARGLHLLLQAHSTVDEHAAASAPEADINGPIDLAEDPADQPFVVYLTDTRGALSITVRPSTSVRRLLEAYAGRRGLAVLKTRLLLQSGQLIADTGTAAQAGLTADAVLSCLQLL